MDMKEKKLTVVGDVDPVSVANKVRKFWHADISHVGLAKEEDKKKDGDKKKDPNVIPPYIVVPSYVQVTEDYPQCCVIC